MITIERTSIGSWANCVQVSNNHVSLTATLDVGPRIISLFLPGKRNIFFQNRDQIGLTGGTEWRAYGGHRFWIAPEDNRTVFPDNRPVSVRNLPTGICLTAPVEESNGFQKCVQVELSTDAPHVHLTHTLTNQSKQSQSAAPWALSVLAPGGTVVLPHSPRVDWPAKLTAQNTVSLWSYTAMSDPRWKWGDRYILLHQAGGKSNPQKIGMFNSEGWAAYQLEDMAFIKFFSAHPDAGYPDLNSNLETFTNNEFLELETLGPLSMVEPGQTISHTEDWYLYGGVSPVKNDADVDQAILPLVRKCQGQQASDKVDPGI